MHPRSPRVRVRGFVSALPGGRGGGGGRGAVVPGSWTPGQGGGWRRWRECPRRAESLRWQVGGHTPGARRSWAAGGACTLGQAGVEGVSCLKPECVWVGGARVCVCVHVGVGWWWRQQRSPGW